MTWLSARHSTDSTTHAPNGLTTWEKELLLFKTNTFSKPLSKLTQSNLLLWLTTEKDTEPLKIFSSPSSTLPRISKCQLKLLNKLSQETLVKSLDILERDQSGLINTNTPLELPETASTTLKSPWDISLKRLPLSRNMLTFFYQLWSKTPLSQCKPDSLRPYNNALLSKTLSKKHHLSQSSSNSLPQKVLMKMRSKKPRPHTRKWFMPNMPSITENTQPG